MANPNQPDKTTSAAASTSASQPKQSGVSAGQIITIIILILLVIVSWAMMFYFRGSNQDLPEYTRDDVTYEDVIENQNANVTVNTNTANTNVADSTNDTAPENLADDQPLPPDVPVWDTIENEELGVRLDYPDIFQYGVKLSKKEPMIQITTYDPSDQVATDAFDTFPGIKWEMISEPNTDNLTLLEYAARVSGGDEPTVTFEELTIDGRDALKGYEQNSSFTGIGYFIDDGDTFYVILITADNQEYADYGSLLDDMLDNIEFDI